MSNKPKILGSREVKQCHICSRRFTTNRIKIHEAICQKSASLKRKLFDPSIQRIKGTDFEKISDNVNNKSSFQRKNKKGPTPLATDWHLKHNDLMNTLKSIKMYEAERKTCGQKNDLPLTPTVDCKDSVRCPHCSRLFNSMAAQHHISMCEKNMWDQTKSKTNMSTEN